jgi:hypothetical protein
MQVKIPSRNILNHKDLLEFLYSKVQEGDQFLDKLDPSVRSAFYDNPYAISQGLMIENLIKFIYDEDPVIVDLIFWFLFEKRPDSNEVFQIRSKTLNLTVKYELSSLDSIVNFIEECTKPT